MANSFKNYTDAGVGTSPSTSYTVPGGTTAVMVGMTVANVTASAIVVDVQCAGVYLVKGASVPTGSTLSVLDGKVILEASDSVVVTSDTASSADAIISVLEQS